MQNNMKKIKLYINLSIPDTKEHCLCIVHGEICAYTYINVHRFKIGVWMWMRKIVTEDLILARGCSFLSYKNDKMLTVINTRLWELRNVCFLCTFLHFLETFFFFNKIQNHKHTHEEWIRKQMWQWQANCKKV